MTAKKNPGFFTQTSHVMQHLLPWRLPQLSRMVNAARSFAGGCGEATTVDFISCGGLPRHGAFADDLYVAEGQEGTLALTTSRRTDGRRGRLETWAQLGDEQAAEGQTAGLENA
jgi:hypothetical protein